MLLLLWMLCLILASCSDSAAPIYQGSDVQILDIGNLSDLEAEFKRYGYQLDSLEQGVPAIILQSLPSDLPDESSSKKRKNIFFKSILPMILLANDEIRHERKQVIELKRKIDKGQPLDLQQRRELEIVAERYKVNIAEVSPQNIAELLIRVDIIPRDLVLAQAANESAWGTSRFSQLANNLFGEWTFIPGSGIVPEDRPEGATYEIRRFDNIYDSIRAYLLNLNSHSAYEELRQLRAAARFAGEPLNGFQLAEGLLRYSIRGEDYVKDLQNLIRKNRLTRFANATLRTSG
ncbi:MAG TPA: glucosaminidase domain-containing protein [Malonomonas sp.]